MTTGPVTVGHALSGGGALDPATPAASLLDGVDGPVAVVPLAAAYARPAAVAERIETWATARGIEVVTVPTVRRADALDPAVAGAVAAAAGAVVVDGAGAHLVSGLKATPLLEALVELAARAPVVWSGTSASAACDPMVDERGGALTVGLGVVDDAIVVPAWEGWSRDARRRLRRLVPVDRLVVGLPTGTAIVPGEHPEGWSPVGPGVEAERGGEVVALD